MCWGPNANDARSCKQDVEKCGKRHRLDERWWHSSTEVCLIVRRPFVHVLLSWDIYTTYVSPVLLGHASEADPDDMEMFPPSSCSLHPHG
jgi:hypothetical protein